jgi:O-antigen/teichoic acid export membrane protein
LSEGQNQARVLASGSLAQQASQVTGLIAMFAILTVLARRLTLEELGIYGLLSSLAGYLLVVQNAAAAAAVRAMAGAATDRERSASFSDAAVVYVAAGVVTGLLLAAIGFVLSGVVDLSDSLADEARKGSLLLGLVTAVGWPATIWRDALRAHQRFTTAAFTDIAGLLVFCAVQLGLVFGGASLWLVIGASGTIPLFAGLTAFFVARRAAPQFRFRREGVSRAGVRDLVAVGWYVSLNEAAGVIIYALDRIVLGVFKSATVVGLYEGPVRVHNLVRALNAALNVTVLPSASRYLAQGDVRRLRELLVRGSRYALAIVVPLTVTVMVLAGPILEVWLGAEFVEGQAALVILVSYWLVNGSLGITGAMLVAAGRASTIARYAWSVAIANLILSIALVGPLGLEGVALGTTIPYVVAFPFYLRLVLTVVPVRLGELARESWLPAYSAGVGLAVALLAARALLELDTVVAVVAVAGAGLASYWLAFYGLWLRPSERELVRDIVRGLRPARAS